ncbi:MAG: aminotransferase class V-fold PLP-dependent enzyme, partial [Chlamydiota bacterium]
YHPVKGEGRKFSWRYDTQTMDYESKVMQSFGLLKKKSFRMTLGKGSSVYQMMDEHYIQEMFISGQQQILTLKTEGAYRNKVCEKLKPFGVLREKLDVNAQGQLTQSSLLTSITPRTSLVSLSWAHPITGVIQPVEEIARLCHEKGVFCHVDISSVIGKLYLDLEGSKIDYITFDARTFQGPYQVEGIFFHNKAKKALWGSELEASLELEELSVSLDHALENIDHMNLEIASLRHYFEKSLIQKISCVQVLFQNVDRLPHISVVAFPYIEAEYMLYLLKEEKLYASMGGGDHGLLSEILKDCQVESCLANSALSFAFSSKTTRQEIDDASSRIVKCYTKARSLCEDLVTDGI